MSLFSIDRRQLIGLGLATALIPSRAAISADRTLRWGIDYGAYTPIELARTYDILVLEPGHNREISTLRGPRSKLLGYISLGEIEKNRPYFAALSKAGALLEANANWPDARLVDLRHRAWVDQVIEHIVPGVLAKGYDGIFLDTLDNAEAMERADPNANAGMVAAAVELVRTIRARFPSIMIMQNRGYALLPTGAASIDVLLAEAMASRWSFSDHQYEMTPEEDWLWQANHLRAAKQANPALILTTLDYWDPSDARTVKGIYQRERAADFEPYVATLALDRLLPEPRS